eukprot:TRINITY_DN10190_c0_g4_i1.p1 TRINITY_DN10190_c0_g4~~TRINITY_DN10190_c0_g4_i1.p1  ORF type:complete len:142 (+),score=23.12 TRINITY_DN10190_c0_g4_i1:208-633(+)
MILTCTFPTECNVEKAMLKILAHLRLLAAALSERQCQIQFLTMQPTLPVLKAVCSSQLWICLSLMIQTRVGSNIVAYNAAISACAKAVEGSQHFDAQVKGRTAVSDAVSYKAAISACEKAVTAVSSEFVVSPEKGSARCSF